MGRRAFAQLPQSILWKGRWRRTVFPLIVVVVAGCISLLDRSQQPPSSDDWQRYHDQSFAVSRVVDGDTLDIEAPDGDKPVTRIRLWGVDTPEVAHGAVSTMHFGEQAKQFARQTLEGRRVHIVLSPKKSRGKYGRLLAYVYLERGGAMFNEMLLDQGFAYADARFRHHYYDRFADAEKHARRRGAGLWADVSINKMPKWKQRRERE